MCDPLPVVRHNTLWLFLFVAGLLWVMPSQPTFAATPVMTLSLNEGAGPTFVDSSGYGNQGGCPSPEGGTCPVGTTGKVNVASLFDGASTVIWVYGASTLKPASTVTVSAWIKASTAPTDGGEIISFGDSYAMRMLATGNVRFFFYVGNNTWLSLDTTGLNLLDNTFHHLVGQKTTTGLEIYVDGVQKATNTATGTISYTLGPSLNIGRHANGFATRYFNGTIDEARVYPTPLSASEISALYAAGAALLTHKNQIPLNTGLTPPTTRGTLFSDSSFPGVQLMRLTDASDGTDCVHYYSAFIPTMNVDSTRFLYRCNNNGWRIRKFNPTTLTVDASSDLAAPNGGPERVLWSPVNPDVIVYPLGQSLWWRNVAPGGGFGVERDFTAELVKPGGGYYIVREPNRSQDNDIWVFTKALPPPADANLDVNKKGYIVWKRSTNQILLNVDITYSGGFNEADVDKSGRYVFVVNTTCPEKTPPNNGNCQSSWVVLWIRDLQTGTITPIQYQQSQRPPSHFDAGTGISIENHNNWLPSINRRDLATQQWIPLLEYCVQGQSCPNENWAVNHHLSMNANNEGWVLASTYDCTGTTTNPPMQNEIFQVATDGSTQVRRITHHHSQVGGCDYWSMPRANMSEDGRFVTWTSNWPGVNQRHVYMAIIPPAP